MRSSPRGRTGKRSARRRRNSAGAISSKLAAPAVANPGQASAWYGIAAPAGTPAGIVERLNQELNAAFADPKMKARIVELGGTPLPGSPTDFAKLFADETEKWAKVVKLSGAKAD